jgi:nitric oxide reductase activation protein
MTAPAPQTNPAGPQGARVGPEPDPVTHSIEERMAERRNSERQKMLVADTDKLLALAQQLKADVDKTDKDVLSIDVVKRAEQIEKLAKSVKEKMRGN